MAQFFKVDVPGNDGSFFVVVDPDQEQVWKDTQRYLADAGFELEVRPTGEYPRSKAYTPSELSDVLAPRDD